MGWVGMEDDTSKVIDSIEFETTKAELAFLSGLVWPFASYRLA